MCCVELGGWIRGSFCLFLLLQELLKQAGVSTPAAAVDIKLWTVSKRLLSFAFDSEGQPKVPFDDALVLLDVACNLVNSFIPSWDSPPMPKHLDILARIAAPRAWPDSHAGKLASHARSAIERAIESGAISVCAFADSMLRCSFAAIGDAAGRVEAGAPVIDVLPHLCTVFNHLTCMCGLGAHPPPLKVVTPCVHPRPLKVVTPLQRELCVHILRTGMHLPALRLADALALSMAGSEVPRREDTGMLMAPLCLVSFLVSGPYDLSEDSGTGRQSTVGLSLRWADPEIVTCCCQTRSRCPPYSAPLRSGTSRAACSAPGPIWTSRACASARRLA